MDQIREFDRSAIGAIRKLPGSLRLTMLFASLIGSPVLGGVILLVVLGQSYSQKNNSIFTASVTLLLALPLANLIKILTKRARPNTVYVEHMWFNTYSFPSAHAYSSVLTFCFLADFALRYLLSPWSYIVTSLLIFLIILVGVSRVYLGAHFPTDVIGGWTAAGIVLFLVIQYIV